MQTHVLGVGCLDWKNRCWDVDGIERVAKADGMKVERFIATHYHWDHIGGPIKGRGYVRACVQGVCIYI